MHRLSTYISAIHGRANAVTLVDGVDTLEQYNDELAETRVHEHSYRFSNGVELRRRLEEEIQPSEQLCGECWISYRVTDAGGLPIRPLEKSFSNRCQERFWLNMQAAQGSL